jgi:hypothetical protein
MSDQQQDAMAEYMFTGIAEFDSKCIPAVWKLADLIAMLPDEASQAHNKTHFLVLLLREIESKSSADWFVTTLDKLQKIIDYRTDTGEWPEEGEL